MILPTAPGDFYNTLRNLFLKSYGCLTNAGDVDPCRELLESFMDSLLPNEERLLDIILERGQFNEDFTEWIPDSGTHDAWGNPVDVEDCG